MYSLESIQESRLKLVFPVILPWWPGSIKSGPTLKGATLYPASARYARRARVRVVFPVPLPVAPITNPLIIFSCIQFLNEKIYACSAAIIASALTILAAIFDPPFLPLLVI